MNDVPYFLRDFFILPSRLFLSGAGIVSRAKGLGWFYHVLSFVCLCVFWSSHSTCSFRAQVEATAVSSGGTLTLQLEKARLERATEPALPGQSDCNRSKWCCGRVGVKHARQAEEFASSCTLSDIAWSGFVGYVFQVGRTNVRQQLGEPSFVHFLLLIAP
jgi:hypothetical protein